MNSRTLILAVIVASLNALLPLTSHATSFYYQVPFSKTEFPAPRSYYRFQVDAETQKEAYESAKRIAGKLAAEDGSELEGLVELLYNSGKAPAISRGPRESHTFVVDLVYQVYEKTSIHRDLLQQWRTHRPIYEGVPGPGEDPTIATLKPSLHRRYTIQASDPEIAVYLAKSQLQTEVGAVMEALGHVHGSVNKENPRPEHGSYYVDVIASEFNVTKGAPADSLSIARLDRLSRAKISAETALQQNTVAVTYQLQKVDRDGNQSPLGNPITQHLKYSSHSAENSIRESSADVINQTYLLLEALRLPVFERYVVTSDIIPTRYSITILSKDIVQPPRLLPGTQDQLRPVEARNEPAATSDGLGPVTIGGICDSSLSSTSPKIVSAAGNPPVRTVRKVARIRASNQ